jgi:hypothetical protein
MNEGSIGSMKELGITESYKLKRQVVLSASEAAEMIIRCVVIMVQVCGGPDEALQCGRHSSSNTSKT